jgi:hypothetical protein
MRKSALQAAPLAAGHEDQVSVPQQIFLILNQCLKDENEAWGAVNLVGARPKQVTFR